MKEVNEVMAIVKSFAAEDAHIIFGAVYDESMVDSLRVTVVATGLGQVAAASATVGRGRQAFEVINTSVVQQATGTHDVVGGFGSAPAIDYNQIADVPAVFGGAIVTALFAAEYYGLISINGAALLNTASAAADAAKAAEDALAKFPKDEAAAIEMRFSSNQARFSFSGLEFVTKLVEGKFPDYNRVIPKNHKFRLTLGRAPLLASLQRAAILTSEKFKAVRLTFEPGLLSIASSNAEQEEAKEEIEIDYDGDKIETGFNVTYLMDALSNMSQDMVCIDLNDSASSALLTIPDTTGFKYVVMPMRI